jgi:hypothetical protein
MEYYGSEEWAGVNGHYYHVFNTVCDFDSPLLLFLIGSTNSHYTTEYQRVLYYEIFGKGCRLADSCTPTKLCPACDINLQLQTPVGWMTLLHSHYRRQHRKSLIPLKVVSVRSLA